jgi:hypothetical protein
VAQSWAWQMRTCITRESLVGQGKAFMDRHFPQQLFKQCPAHLDPHVGRGTLPREFVEPAQDTKWQSNHATRQADLATSLHARMCPAAHTPKVLASAPSRPDPNCGLALAYPCMSRSSSEAAGPACLNHSHPPRSSSEAAGPANLDLKSVCSPATWLLKRPSSRPHFPIRRCGTQSRTWEAVTQ